MVDAGKVGGTMPYMAQESKSTLDEVHLLGLARCLSFLEDSIFSKVKEEAQGMPISEDL